MKSDRGRLFDALMSTPHIYGVQVSPDLQWVAWTCSGMGPTTNVFFAPTDGSRESVQLTDVPGQNTFLCSFAFDSASAVVAHDTDGNERVQLFQVSLAHPQILKPLTEKNPDYFITGGRLHPNGRYVVYGANYDFQKKCVVEPSIVYRHDVQTGERKVLATPAKSIYVPTDLTDLNALGTHVVYPRADLDPSGRQIWLVDIEGKEDREILNFGPQTKVSASWFPSGDRLVVLAEKEGRYRRVGIWYLADERMEWILDDPERNIENAWVPEGSACMLISEFKNASANPLLIDLETREARPLDGPRVCMPHAQLSDTSWVATYANATQPADVVVYNAASRSIERSISNLWEKVLYATDDLVSAEDFRWKSVDGLTIQGWVYRALGAPKGTIVLVHGGPAFHSEDRFRYEDRFELTAQFFAAQGFNVFEPNFRGSTGFSLSFQNAIKEDGWGGKDQDDIIEGIKALIQAGIAETGKVGITGLSYGGYSSWCALTRVSSDLVAAGAPICGMTDLVLDYETTRPELRNYVEEMMGGSPAEVPERYYRGSPIHFVHQIQGKLLIVQGAMDTNVTPENVVAMEKELQKYDIPYETLIFEDEGHVISRPKNQKLLYGHLVAFFEKAFLP